jgi:hypothetical protein
MKQQVGVIVLGEGMNVEPFKQSFRDEYETVDPKVRKPIKLAFVENDGAIEVWEE